MSRSPFFYVGDKYKLVPQLLELFPNGIDRFIEPFCGGGSVFLNVAAKEYFEADNNPWMIKLHKYLCSFKGKRKLFFKKMHNVIISYGLSASYLGINVPQDLKQKHVKTYYSVFNKKAYTHLKEDFNKDQNDLLKLYILLVYGFNHMLRFNGAGVFNLPVGNVDYNKNVYNALNAYFDFIDNNKPVFKTDDFRSFIKKTNYRISDFVYLDPPYLITSSEYNKYWTEKEEIELLKLLDWLNDQKIRFALSNVFSHKGKSNDLLIEWSKKYHVHYLKSNYISYFDNTIKKDTIEVLITNYANS